MGFHLPPSLIRSSKWVRVTISCASHTHNVSRAINVIVEIDFAIFWQSERCGLNYHQSQVPKQYLQLRALALLRDVLALIQSNDVQNQREYASTVLSQKLLRSSQKWGISCTVEILEIKVPHPS